MIVNTTQMFKQAEAGSFAIPSTNFLDFRMARAFIDKAESLNMPIILSFAQSHIPELSLEDAANIGLHLARKASIPVALHLDHGEDEETVKKAISLGFSSVMIDASMCEYEENIAITKRIVEYAHQHDVTVEAELGHVGSGENFESHDESDSIYTNPQLAKDFCLRTGVDSLAISIGTAHGHYKGTPKINFEILAEIRNQVKNPLVLHGGSSSGEENLNRCALSGIRKINIFTDFISASYDAINNGSYNNMIEINHAITDAYQDTLGYYYKVFATKKWEVANETRV